MKINFNKLILVFSLILILLLSLGIVSASNNSNDLIDMTYDDNIITEDSIDSVSDLSSLPKDEYLNSDDGCISYDNELSNSDSSSNKEVLTSSGENSFSHIQDLIDQSIENDTIVLNGTYGGDSKL